MTDPVSPVGTPGVAHPVDPIVNVAAEDGDPAVDPDNAVTVTVNVPTVPGGAATEKEVTAPTGTDVIKVPLLRKSSRYAVGVAPLDGRDQAIDTRRPDTDAETPVGVPGTVGVGGGVGVGVGGGVALPP